MPHDQRQVHNVKSQRVFRPPREPTTCFAKIFNWNELKNCGVISIDIGSVLVLRHRLYQSSKITEPSLNGKWVRFFDTDIEDGNKRNKLLKRGNLVTDEQEIAQLEIEASRE